jgi:lipopolysaccharide/colanic/teichoic acid biosynthesis glycosyltransferase
MAVHTPSPPVLAVSDHARVSVRVRPAAPVAIDPLAKRLFDISLSLLMLILSAPVWLAIAAAIKMGDGGPVFYRQERWGRDQLRFQVLKFRTMVTHSDREFGVRQATAHDQRITRVGRTLRATGLDELPQILNILLGDMSFVGPRALATNERSADGAPICYEETSGFARRLQVRPGLTGLATIYLPKDAPSPLKFRVDLLYVSRLSFWLDLRLVALSFWISFRGKWETRANKL